MLIYEMTQNFSIKKKHVIRIKVARSQKVFPSFKKGARSLSWALCKQRERCWEQWCHTFLEDGAKVKNILRLNHLCNILSIVSSNKKLRSKHNIAEYKSLYLWWLERVFGWEVNIEKENAPFVHWSRGSQDRRNPLVDVVALRTSTENIKNGTINHGFLGESELNSYHYSYKNTRRHM